MLGQASRMKAAVAHHPATVTIPDAISLAGPNQDVHGTAKTNCSSFGEGRVDSEPH